jgi:RNA-binding motif protein, X-linked 2
MPREKATGKRRGFAFLMYEDQRSTVLAVDNLNGADLLGRTLRVDHVQNYKQKEMVDGKWVDRESERLNVKPEPICVSSHLPRGSSHTLFVADEERAEESDASASSAGSIDKEDPMREYLIEQRRENKMKSKKSKKHADETPEERRARKERKRAKKLAKEGSSLVTSNKAHGGNHTIDTHMRSSSPRGHPRDTGKRSRDMSQSPGRGDRNRRRSASPRRRHDYDRSNHERRDDGPRRRAD